MLIAHETCTMRSAAAVNKNAGKTKKDLQRVLLRPMPEPCATQEEHFCVADVTAWGVPEHNQSHALIHCSCVTYMRSYPLLVCDLQHIIGAGAASPRGTRSKASAKLHWNSGEVVIRLPRWHTFTNRFVQLRCGFIHRRLGSIQCLALR